MYRFYIDNPLKIGEILTIPKDELHHMKKVMRVQSEEKIEIVNGKGDIAIGKFANEITLISKTHSPPDPYKKILALANPLQNHLEIIIEKGTELGISDFILFPSVKSPIRKFSDAKKNRCKKISISSIKQCKRLYLPKISFINSPENLPAATYYLGDPNGTFPSIKQKSDIAFIIGPESGFTKEETSYFTEITKAIPTKLSDNILRCETAAIISSYLLNS